MKSLVRVMCMFVTGYLAFVVLIALFVVTSTGCDKRDPSVWRSVEALRLFNQQCAGRIIYYSDTATVPAVFAASCVKLPPAGGQP